MTTKRSNAIHSGRRCRRWAIKAPAHYYQTPRLPLYLTYTPPSMAFLFISGLVMSMRFPRVWWYPSQNEVCWEGWRSTIVLLIGLPPPRKRHQKQTLTHKFALESETFYNWRVSSWRPYSGTNWQVSTDGVRTIGSSCQRRRKLSLFKELYFWQDYAQHVGSHFCKT